MSCPTCGGPILTLGKERETWWGRCQDCGWLLAVPEPEDDEEESEQESLDDMKVEPDSKNAEPLES
jgi:hypothetical protein